MNEVEVRMERVCPRCRVYPCRCPELFEETQAEVADLQRQLAEYDAALDGARRQLADERARIDCATRGGWLSDDLECAGEDGPACWKHLLAEAQAALLRYGEHDGTCPDHKEMQRPSADCDCGLGAAYFSARIKEEE